MTTATQPASFQQYEHESQRFVRGFEADNPKAIVQYVRFSKLKRQQGRTLIEALNDSKFCVVAAGPERNESLCSAHDDRQAAEAALAEVARDDASNYYVLPRKPTKDRNGSGRARQRRGVIVAFIGMGGELRIGWSLFNTNHESRAFSRAAGLRKAIERARTPDEYEFDTNYRADDQDTHNGVPQTIRRPIQSVLERARRYYKV